MPPKEKVLVTGGTGFIGQYLVPRLLAEGYEVHVMCEDSRNLHKVPEGAFRPICALGEYNKMEKLIEKIQPEYVIHLAAKTEVAFSFNNYREVSEVNYVGTVSLAEANRKFNPNLKLFIMATTMETYGWHDKEEGAFTEDTKQRPRAPYAVAKLACEHYLRYMHFAYKFPFTGFRQTNAYGRKDNDFFVTEKIISQMVRNEVVCKLGDPNPWRNFLFIEDLIDLYLTVIKNPDKAKGEFFVTGPDNALPIHKLADMIKEKLNYKGTIQWNTMPPRPGEIFYLNSNPAKAKKLLGWEPKVSLSEGLDKTIAIWEKNYVKAK